MRNKCTLIGAVAAFLTLCGCTGDKLPLATLEPEQRVEFQAWLNEHGASPEEYIASKFVDHDIVFLGEYHRIRHDALLVQNLIPVLYRHGVYNLGLEFLQHRDQADLDRLLAAATYDEALAQRLFWNQWPWWGYQEYVDILRAAWELNRELPAGARRFRVVGLNARADFSHMWTPEDRANPEIMKKVFPEGDGDEVMAESIRREVLSRSEKALIYSGINHAYTRFQQPVVNEATGEVTQLVSTRMGNRIAAEIGNRCCTIFLHSPWPAASGYAAPQVYPADGVIDAFFASLSPKKRRVGFDITGSPFGQFPVRSSLWARAATDFRLEMFCDGWIYQVPLSQYQGVTVIPGWFNETNRSEAIAQIANPDPRIKYRDRSVQDLMAPMASDTDFKRRFAQFY